MVELTRPRMAALDIPVKLQVTGEPEYVKETIQFTKRSLLKLSQNYFVKDDFIVESLFTAANPIGIHGMAFVGSACRDTPIGGAPIQPLAFSSLWSKEDRDFHAASTHAHELGHTLGLR